MKLEKNGNTLCFIHIYSIYEATWHEELLKNLVLCSLYLLSLKESQITFG